MLAAEDEDDADAARFATACRTRFIDPLKARLRDEKDKQSKRREKIDTARVARLPSIERQNESAQQAMLDMAIVHAEYIGKFKEDQTLPRMVRRCLNSLGYGVSAYRTFPGRPGEWSRMKRSAIVACLGDKDCWYIVITDHKTQKSIPNLGRLVPDDVKFTFEHLVDFGTPSRDLLYEPTSERGQTVQIHNLAKDFAQMYDPECEYPEPNAKVLRNDDRAQRKSRQGGAHGRACGKIRRSGTSLL